MFTYNPMRGVRHLALLIFVGLSAGTTSSAALLHPGSTIPVPREYRAFDPASPGPDLLAATNFTFASEHFTGVLISQVWSGDEWNELGGLTFFYRIINQSDCYGSIGHFSLGGFADSLLDVNFAGLGVVPSGVNRSVDGSEMTFSFFNRSGDETLLPDRMSTWLIVHTDAHDWQPNQLVGMDSLEVTAATFTPVGVPEPTIAAILGLAGFAAAFARQRNREQR